MQRVLNSAEGDGSNQALTDLERAIQRARGGGQPLNSDVQTRMETAFGAGFGDVRIGAQADSLNRSLNARAFTTGRDIFFRNGGYNPRSSRGQELLAHELTHAVQQKGAQVQHSLSIGQPGDRYEQEADRVAKQFVSADPQPEFGQSDGAQAQSDDSATTIPSYLQAVFSDAQSGRPDFRLALQSFRQQHSDSTLERYRSKLTEPNHPIEVVHRSPLKQVRCMGREPSEREQALEQVQIGDDEFVMEVCRFFYPENPPDRVNDQLRELAARMLWSATEKSRALDLVPRPPGSRPSPTWLLSQAVKAAWRAAQDRGYYEIVRRTVALQYRSQYELARMGL